MNAPDLHPEELIDRAARGTLSAFERATLDRHLAACATCRFEQQARADFAAIFRRPERTKFAQAGKSNRDDEAAAADLNLDSMVTAALAGIQRPARRRVSSRAGVMIAAALSVLAFSSFAAVAQLTGVLPKLIHAMTVSEPAPAPAPPPEPAPLHSSRASAPIIVPVQPEPAPAEEAQKVEPPVVTHRSVPAPSREPATPAIPEVAVKRAPPPPDAASLFASANDARTHGDRRAAVVLYRDLLAQFPGSDEANITHAALGRLLLDEGDPAGALAELRAYLAGGDAALREEALADCAMASGKLGRASDERDCWKTLLETYPSSVHADRARGRLGELGEP